MGKDENRKECLCPSCVSLASTVWQIPVADDCFTRTWPWSQVACSVCFHCLVAFVLLAGRECVSCLETCFIMVQRKPSHLFLSEGALCHWRGPLPWFCKALWHRGGQAPRVRHQGLWPAPCCSSQVKRQCCPELQLSISYVHELSGRLEQRESWSCCVLVGFKLTHFIYCELSAGGGAWRLAAAC